MSPKQFRAWLASYGPLPIRGLSPARGARFGKVALVAFEELGENATATAMLGAVIDSLPEEARRFAAEILADAEQHKLRLRRGGKAVAE
jgi:hypothetical protein